MKENVKNALSFIGRLGLSAGLLFWLFRNINWADTMESFRTAEWHLLGGAFAIFFLLNIFCLIRWQVFMKALSLKAPLGMVFRYFFIGLFCNLFLPTSIGGDVVKAIGLSNRVGQKPKVVASILLDRLSGFGGLVVLALGAYVFGHAVIDAPAVIIPVLALTCVSLVIGFMLFHDRVYEFCCRIFIRIPRLHKALMDMHADVVMMKRRKRTALACVGLSIVVQALAAYMYYLIAQALGQSVGLPYFLVFAPIVSAVSFLPSIGGLGVREFGWVYFLGRVGVAQGIAMSVSLISFSFIVVIGILGGIFYVTTVPDRRVQCPAADAGAEQSHA